MAGEPATQSALGLSRGCESILTFGNKAVFGSMRDGVVPDLVEKLKVEWLNHSVISISYEKIELQKKGEATHGQATQSRR